MPQYLYTDDAGHEQQERHTIAECDTAVIACNVCGAVMHRKPVGFRVVWGGLPPHLEHTRPTYLQNFLDDTPRRRDEYYRDRESWRANKAKAKEAANAKA